MTHDESDHPYHTMRMEGLSADGYWEEWQCTGCSMHESRKSYK